MNAAQRIRFVKLSAKAQHSLLLDHYIPLPITISLVPPRIPPDPLSPNHHLHPLHKRSPNPCILSRILPPLLLGAILLVNPLHILPMHNPFKPIWEVYVYDFPGLGCWAWCAAGRFSEFCLKAASEES